MIGVSSPSFSSYPIEDVLPGLARFFKHWEIVSEAEHQLPLIAPRLAMMMENYDMTFSLHAPFCDINIASLNERIRESSVMEIINMVEYAVNMNMRTVTFHPGLYSMAVPDMQERSVMNAKRSLRMLDRISEEYGVIMALENMPSMPFMLGHTAEEMSFLIDGTNLPICFDVGHANTVGEIDKIIDALGDRIVNVHIHDNDGTADKHMTIGDGNIDFEACIKKLGRYMGNYIIESRSLESAVESLDRISLLLR
ncbi:MAG: sugar phosphate isomerase/epimerase [Thermoplasmata archaeon]|nr:sugar phosphate isomerase/epimerase [Thermoplasmata archaeon]